MKISELQPKQGNVEIEAVIAELGETRTYNKFGRELSVADAVIKDDSGTMKLTLWNDDIPRFKAGDKVKVINGYVNEFQGEMSLTSGKFGKIEKVDGSEGGEGVGETTQDASGEENTLAEESVGEATQENMNDELIEREKEVSKEVKGEIEETAEVQDAAASSETVKPEDLI